MPKGIYKRTKPTWNKGLTKETDERVRKNAESNSIAHKGKPSSRKGIKSSEKSKLKMTETLRKGYKEGKYKIWCDGVKLTEKHIENLRKSHKGQIPSPKSGSRGNRYHHISPLQGMVCFRSSFEYKYALYLEYKHEPYLYEEFNFDLGNTTYRPDFFLPRLEKFIDTKGYLTKECHNKISKFLEEYPWDLEILYKKDLEMLGINMEIDILEIPYKEAETNESLTKINTNKIIERV